MFNVKKYVNFNSQPETGFKTLHINNQPVAALCIYNKTDHSTFFIEEPTFTYVAIGTKYMIINNKEFFLKAGDLLYIPKNTIVFTYIPRQETGFESINLILPGALIKENALLNKIALVNSSALSLKNKTIKNAFSQLRKTIHTLSLKDIQKKELYFTCLSTITTQMCFNENNKSFAKKLNAEDLEKIKNVFIENIYKSISISNIAQQCNMSLSTFKRKFELAFGAPPKTWKRAVCLQTAFFNLKTKNYKIADLVDPAGFESFSHFSFAFKKQFNFSPSVISENKLS